MQYVCHLPHFGTFLTKVASPRVIMWNFCWYSGNIENDISCIIKNSPAFARPYRKPPQKIRGAIISILPVSLYRFKDVLFNYIAYRINRRFVKFFLEKIWEKRAKRNLRFLCTPACHAWQALRKVLLSIFRKYRKRYFLHNKKIPGPLCRGRGKNR